MRIISDLHLHSKYARGCSKDLNIQNIERWSRIKGIDIIGSGDFTHPKWINEIKENLTETDDGILKTKNGFPFILTSEISLIYTDMGKVRKIHNIVWAPNLDVVSQITEYLSKKGRIDYDGRP
ncbi:MAG: DNA helicase UvrD, partial [Candidatus Woesearchaeota archaeon]